MTMKIDYVQVARLLENNPYYILVILGMWATHDGKCERYDEEYDLVGAMVDTVDLTYGQLSLPGFLRNLANALERKTAEIVHKSENPDILLPHMHPARRAYVSLSLEELDRRQAAAAAILAGEWQGSN